MCMLTNNSFLRKVIFRGFIVDVNELRSGFPANL